MSTIKVVFICFLFTFLSSELAAQDDNQWRTPNSKDLVYLQTDKGLVIIELASFMAPKHAKRFENLVNEGFYDGLDFYRVIDGFVAQGGDMSGEKSSKFKSPLKAEFTRSAPEKSNFQLEQSPDFMAPQTGFLYGFPAGHDPETKEEWLLHCPGTVAMARSSEKDSATTDFYIVVGQATRHLDRNMSTFGKVIFGMPVIQSLSRASINVASGVIEDESSRSKILWAKMANNVPGEQRINVQVLKQNSEAAQNRLKSARKLDNEFFHFKGNGNLDMCYYQLKTRTL
ncbi:MAG: peptidylprolyl isomerase [Aliiglaciecola sp.]|uniref:peptidylprolyl isomerase n=1 Tax=Aliiglaciecola sp. M165 TaxID=2593649 RepID=UPI0021B13EF0|nr:peptidylprolyl isomerase [Aliiglaciecola sp. M165]